MKKTRTLFALAGLLLAAIAYAATYTGSLISNPTLAINTAPSLNMNTIVRGGITQLSAQAVYSSATVAASTFNDGSVSTGSITVSNPAALLSVAATNQVTLAATNVLLANGATNYLTVLSTQSLTNAVITYGPNAVRQGHEWTGVATTTGTATAIAAALNKYYGMTATVTGSIVNMTLLPGSAGNGRALSVNVSSITAGGAAFGGGWDNRIVNADITVNGQHLRQGHTWFAASTSSGTATNLAAIMNKVTGVKASAVGSVIYATATVSGLSGNALTITSNEPSYVTAAAKNFSGGQDNAYVRINGVTLTQGTNWTAVATSSGTAQAISNAIQANSSLSSVISSTWNASGVVSATSTVAGASQNYTLVTNYPSNLTLSGAHMTGGLTPAYTPGSAVISIPSHGLGTGMAVTYTTAGTVLSPLSNSTVYYAAKIDANTIALATTNANAAAGTYITLTSSTTTGPHTFTLTPSAITGSAGLVWQVSNDCASWTNMPSVSSVTFATPFTAAQTNWNFGTVGYTCVRPSFTAPTTGAVNMQVTVNGN